LLARQADPSPSVQKKRVSPPSILHYATFPSLLYVCLPIFLATAVAFELFFLRRMVWLRWCGQHNGGGGVVRRVRWVISLGWHPCLPHRDMHLWWDTIIINRGSKTLVTCHLCDCICMRFYILILWLKSITRNTVYVYKYFFRIKKKKSVWKTGGFQSNFDLEPPLFPFSPHGITAQPVTVWETKASVI